MLKVISQLEHKIGEKYYRFICDCDSPLEHVKEVLSQFMQVVEKIEEKVKLEQAALAEQAKSEAQISEVKNQE